MDEYLQWLLAGFGLALCLLAVGLSHRAFKRAEANRKSKRAIAEARAEALRLAADEAARQQAERQAAAQRAVQAAQAAEARRLAEAAHAQAERLTAEQLARVEAARALAAQAAAEEAARAARRDAEEAARAEAARAQAVRLAGEQAARAVAQEAAHREADRQARVDAAARAAASPTLPAKTPEQTLIMVADDSKIVRVKTGRLLAQHQYRVFYANDGLDAAQQMQTTVPDVVITDVEMPGMDGFELTRHVRQNPLTAHIPVIMITAADERHREHARHAGVSVLLGKPYPEEDLIAHIRQAMNHGQAQAGALV